MEELGQPEAVALWLDEAQQRAWRGVVQLFMKLPAALESELQRTTGLTLFEYEVLAVLSESDGRTLQMSELASGTNSSLSRLSHVVTRLEKRSWITRQVCPNDGRATQAVLTRTGAEVVVRAAPKHVRAVRELVLDALTSAQLRQLGIAGVKIGQRIDAMRSTAATNDNNP